MIETHQDSFDEYRKYLENTLGIYGVEAPPRPMTAYTRFFFQRTCQQKSKGSKNMNELSRGFGEEWRNLPAKKKEYYQKIYKVRGREREDLQQQYEILTKKKKPLNGYVKYYTMRFKQISKNSPSLAKQQVGKMATGDWKNLNASEKAKYNNEAAEQQASRKMSPEERQERIELYNQKVRRFSEQLKEEKQKIRKRFGLDESLKEKKKAELINQRNAKILAAEVEKVKKEEERKRKRQEQREAKKQQKQEQKKKRQQERQQKRKEEREKKAADSAVKKQSRSQSINAKKQAKKESKKNAEGTKKAESTKKSEGRKKRQSKKPAAVKKTKQIKKAAKGRKGKGGKTKKAPTPKKAAPKKIKVQVKKEVKEEIVQAPVVAKKDKKVSAPPTKRTTRASKK